MRRIGILAPALAIAAVALAAIGGAASANGGPNEGDSSTPGVLEASGDGIAAAAGKLSLRLCAEEGILLAKGKVEIEEGSYAEEIGWLGLHVYFGFHGCAEVTGGSMYAHAASNGGGSGRAAALVVGTGLELRAEGTGIAFLKGAGEWAKDSGESGEWSEEGSIIRIGGKEKPKCEVTAQHNKPKCKTPTAEPTDEPEPEPTETPEENEEP